MARHHARSLQAFAVAAVVAVSAGPVDAGTDTTEPPGSAASVAGCAEITSALGAADAFVLSFVSGDIETLQEVVAGLPGIATDAAAAAPDEISEAVETWVSPIPMIVGALAEIDLSDPDAFEEAVTAIDTRASDTARGEVAAWAASNCGWTSSLDSAQIEAPEPADCEALDAAAAAEAAGIEVDVTDLDGSADVNLPGFWTKSCSYGNGAMNLSTLSFNAIEDAQRFYADNLDVASGVILDVSAGTLPESSLVIQTGVATGTSVSAPGTAEPVATVPPTVQVTVFEAPIPFSVSFTGDDIDPAAVVAAAEAVLAALPGAAQPPATDAPTTT